MSTNNRTFYNESNVCKSLPLFLLKGGITSLLLFATCYMSAQSTIPAYASTEVDPAAYERPLNHGPDDGYTEVFYEAGMDATLADKTNLILQDIFFAYGDDEILPQSEPILDDLVRILGENPNMAIELSAHTDSRGTVRYNERLSRDRAREMVKYLTRKGISGSRLIAVGNGENNPRNHCEDGMTCTEAEHRENRRIEMRAATIVGSLPTRSDYIYKY